MKHTKYTMIYGVLCRDIKILSSPDIHNLVRISYKVKGGRKLYKCWIQLSELIRMNVL